MDKEEAVQIVKQELGWWIEKDGNIERLKTTPKNDGWVASRWELAGWNLAVSQQMKISEQAQEIAELRKALKVCRDELAYIQEMPESGPGLTKTCLVVTSTGRDAIRQADEALNKGKAVTP